MEKLLELQVIDLKIEALKKREEEIPKQKRKFNIQRERLKKELEESEDRYKKLQLEQKDCEGEIDLKQEDIRKKDGQLLQVKKNDEYQALLHEIDMIKKQIGIKEERIIAIMLETDDTKARLEEDKQRIASEQTAIQNECGKIDAELAEAIAECRGFEEQRKPVMDSIDRELVIRYARIRKAKKTGPAIVPLRGESCSGCNMAVTAQVVNEILAGERVHVCRHCGRILYNNDNVNTAEVG